MRKKILKQLNLLRLLSRDYGVFFLDSTIDGNKSPPEINGFLRLPIHKTVHKIIEWKTIGVRVQADRLLEELLRELEFLRRRYEANSISDVTIDLILAGVYSAPYNIYEFRSKIKRAIKQLPKYCSKCRELFKEKVCPRCGMVGDKSKIRKYIEWRLMRASEYQEEGPLEMLERPGYIL